MCKTTYFQNQLDSGLPEQLVALEDILYNYVGHSTKHVSLKKKSLVSFFYKKKYIYIFL